MTAAALTEAQADALRAECHRLDKDDFFALGLALLHLADDPQHVQGWGFESWAAWVEQEIGIARRRAECWRRIARFFTRECPIPPNLLRDLRDIGWAKAQLLVERARPDTAAALIKLAAMVTKEELATLLRHVPRGTATAPSSGGVILPEDDEKKVELRFRLSREDTEGGSQLRAVDDALALAGKITGSTSKAHQLTVIATSFTAAHVGTSARDAVRNLVYLGRSLGFDLVVVERASGEIRSGIETLEYLAGGA